MFTTVNEEVAALEKLWSEEEDINVLRARLTIRLEGLKARYRQGRPGFTGNNIQKIEALFEPIETQVSLGEDRDWTEDQLLQAINDLKEIVRSALKQPDLMEIYYDSDFPNQLEKSYRQSLNI